MGKGIILGIDFSTDFTQMAFLDEEGNPQSVSLGTEDNYMIPTAVCYNSQIKEWSAGQEAVNKQMLADSTIYTELLQIIEDDEENAPKLVKVYLAYLLKLASKFCQERPVKNVLVSLEEVTPKAVLCISKVLKELGYNDEDFRVISHTESFVYYVLNQNREIWINKVFFLNFTKSGCNCRKLSVVKGRRGNVASADMEKLNTLVTMDTVENNPEEADKIISEYLTEQFQKNIVSGAYLSGEGFYKGDWKKTLSVLCRNRRVFKGNNLIVKGAVFGAREFFYTPALDNYLISCKGRTKVKVTMAVKHKDRDSNITLSNIGDYWYNAGSTIECIMEEPALVDFTIQDIINHRDEKFQVDLREFPDRPPKTTRIQVDFRYIEENRIQVKIKDLGFGEFFESSGMCVSREISLQQ